MRNRFAVRPPASRGRTANDKSRTRDPRDPPHPRHLNDETHQHKSAFRRWFDNIPFGTKLFVFCILFGVVVASIFAVVAHVQSTKRERDVQVTDVDVNAFHRDPLWGQRTHTSQRRVHVILHNYRGNSDVVARQIFSAFEAAQYPKLVHVHMFQELTGYDTVMTTGAAFQKRQDPYQIYCDTYAAQHGWDASANPVAQNIHVVNENPSKSTGTLMSLLTLVQESVSPHGRPNDILVTAQPFYDLPGTLCIYPLTFATGYDTVLRTAPHMMRGVVYSGRVPRTSCSAQESVGAPSSTTSPTPTSVMQAFSDQLFVPFLKSKSNPEFLGKTTHFTCTAKACRNLYNDQSGFVAFATEDRVVNPTVRQSTVSDVPFSVFQLYRDFYAPHTAKKWSAITKNKTQISTICAPVPVVGIHPDMTVSTVGTWIDAVRYAHGKARRWIIPGPMYIQSLLWSNLFFGVATLYSMNHLPIAAVFDNDAGANTVVDPLTLDNTSTFRPRKWKVVTQTVDNDGDHPNQTVQVKMDDASDVINLDSNFSSYAGVFTDNVTMDGFLGITGTDTASVLIHKFGSTEELERQRRMVSV